MLLQPQPLAKHFLHGLAHWVGVRRRSPRFPPAWRSRGLERIGGVQQLGDGALARSKGRAGGARMPAPAAMASNSRTMVSFTRPGLL